MIEPTRIGGDTQNKSNHNAYVRTVEEVDEMFEHHRVVAVLAVQLQKKRKKWKQEARE